MRKPTIYEVLVTKLGRVPTHREQCDEVARILREAHIEADQERAANGTMPHQRKR